MSEPPSIHPDPDRPTFWRFRERTRPLIGGSSEDNLFQTVGVAGELDRLRAAGGNYVRCTMSCRDEGDLWPFSQRPDGRYDLDQPDENFWQRVADFLQATHERDIIVQIELWDRFDHGRDPYLASPWNPANNVNFTPATSGLATDYPEHPGQTDQPFFRSVPTLDDNPVLLRYQHAFVDRLAELALPMDNILWCMDNETHVRPQWGAYWSGYLKDKAARLGLTIYTTEMWDDHDLAGPQHAYTVDHPEAYDFVDVSQNTHQKGRAAWDNLQAMRQRLLASGSPRPMNCVKVYGHEGPHGNTEHGLHGFWASLLGGCAAVRFHRPPTGLGHTDLAMQHLRAARALDDAIDLANAEPMTVRLGDVDPKERTYASGSLQRGRFGVVMFDGGEATLAVRAAELRWWRWDQNAWGPPEPYRGRLQAPDDGVQVALLR